MLHVLVGSARHGRLSLGQTIETRLCDDKIGVPLVNSNDNHPEMGDVDYSVNGPNTKKYARMHRI